MKRCPECRRDYYDDTLFFCLDDGNKLLDGPASFETERTAILSSFSGPPEAATMIHHSSAPGTPSHHAVPNSIAVLPFSNLSGDPANEYLSDGLSEELLNALAKIDGLRVAARTSAFSFKGRQATVSEIGAALNVSYVLAGSVRVAGSRMRITVNLEGTSDGFQLWSESYDRTLDDIFAVQDDIARTVVEELRTRLSGISPNTIDAARIGIEVADAFRGRAADPEAQRLMLLGRHYLDLTTHDDVQRAVDHFKEALDLDPKFALCWAELGRAYAMRAGSGWMPPVDGFALARDAVERALSLEPDLAEAHALLGRILAAYDWDLYAAEAAYKKALELSPGSSTVLDGACIMAYKLGRLDEAIELSHRVLDKDPLSSAFWHNLGLICQVAGRVDDAEKAYRRALELAPHRTRTASMLAIVLYDQGRVDESLTQFELDADEFWRLWAAVILNSRLGRHDEADKKLAEMLSSQADGNEFQIAEIYGDRKAVDEAFLWLERGIVARDPGVTHALVDPFFTSLHTDPRWPDV